jgi:ubiquinone/menaquinone biosynthesis C-methylase UbiE
VLDPGAAVQDKGKEIEFFDSHARAASQYDVFSEATNQRFVGACVDRCRLRPGDEVLDLGCGSGVFSHLLSRHGVKMTALDISPELVAAGRKLYPQVEFMVGDAENLPLPASRFDGVFLGGVIHHFPRPEGLAREVARVLKPGGAFFAFDPNRRNPFMWLYRDRSSPFYSSIGVTPNERPVVDRKVNCVFAEAGFEVASDYMSVRYQYVASGLARWLLPVYNLVDAALFAPAFMKRHRAFVLTYGRKRQ